MGLASLPLLLDGEDDQAQDAEPGQDLGGPRHAAPATGPHRACLVKATCLGLAAAALLAVALHADPRPRRVNAGRASRSGEGSVVVLQAGSPAPHPVSIDELMHDGGPSVPSTGPAPSGSSPGPSVPSPGPAPPVVRSEGSDVKAATSCLNLDDIALGEGTVKGSADACHSWCKSVDGCVGFQFQAEESCPQLTGEPTLLGKGACLLLLGACEEQASSCWEVHTVSDGTEPWWKLTAENTWCSNWEHIHIGTVDDGAFNQNECGTKCSQRSDCTSFAYQGEACRDHRDNVVRDHTCALFGKGACTQVADSCWNFYSMSGKHSLPTTELTEVAISGDNMLFVKQPEAIQVGNQITITGTGISGHTERAVVEEKDGNEITLDTQIGFSYRPGAKVAVEAIEATEALPDPTGAPTGAPTAAPTEAPSAAPTKAPSTGPGTQTTLTDTTTSKTTTSYTTLTVTATSLTTIF